MSSRFLPSHPRWFSLVALGFGLACGSTPSVDNRGLTSDDVPATPQDAGAGGSEVEEPERQPSSQPPAGNDDVLITDPVSDPGPLPPVGDGGVPPNTQIDPCVLINCERHEFCAVTAGVAACEPNTCDRLVCDPATSRCEALNGGAICVDITCQQDVDCAASEFCDGQRCQQDACQPTDAMCQAGAVMSCASNGSGLVEQFSCSSGSPYFTSECSETGGVVGCGCEDDWDCPQFTACEVGRCVGTGVEPTCSLPPAPFAEDSTQPEISWGGTGPEATAAEGSPYPQFGQVVMTPVVANLNDDNADGLINERDIPEIVFMSFSGKSFRGNGVLRAIHGGDTVRTLNGQTTVISERGTDFFAVCGAETDKRWLEGEGYTGDPACATNEPVLDPTGGVAVGDIDYDGVPEIVVTQEHDDDDTAVYVFSNTGEFIVKSATVNVARAVERGERAQNVAVALANLDAKGHAEIIAGRWVFQLATQPDPNGDPRLVFTNRFEGDRNNGANDQGPISCVANVIDDGDGAVQEVIAGTSVYSMPPPPAGVTLQSDANCVAGPFCAGELTLRWDAAVANPGGELPAQNGFCSVADVLGADAAAPTGPDNPLDGAPEVVTIAKGHLIVMNGQTGEVLATRPIIGGGRGGPPNIDDFDGDGFPEIGLAGQRGYIVADFQPVGASCPQWPDFDDRGSALLPRNAPDMSCDVASDCGDTTQFGCNSATRRCVCLHNGWAQRSQDASSQVTGSSVFDFNGDGAAEVIYNDECRFRVYDGTTGDVLIEKWSESRTRTEYPVVADVDRDGNAEIVFSTSNESGFCSSQGTPAAPRAEFNNGVEVWGDTRDLWVPARAIWNQHAYHVTNVTESGAIPRSEPESWRPLNGRLYNTFRSNPRNFGVAPDLIVRGVQVASPDASCGTLGKRLNVSVDVANQGDLLVGGEVLVGIYGKWGAGDFEPLLDAAGVPLTIALGTSLEARQTRLLTFTDYDPAFNGQGALPDVVKAVVDSSSIETECIEDNNELEKVVEPAPQQPDLDLVIEAVGSARCPAVRLNVTVRNTATVDAADVEVGLYFGDPAGGGTLQQTVMIPGGVPAMGEVTVEVTLAAPRATTVFGVVDPEQRVSECNDANNDAQGPEVICPGAVTR